jgi:hypothetical protein
VRVLKGVGLQQRAPAAGGGASRARDEGSCSSAQGGWARDRVSFLQIQSWEGARGVFGFSNVHMQQEAEQAKRAMKEAAAALKVGGCVICPCWGLRRSQN